MTWKAFNAYTPPLSPGSGDVSGCHDAGERFLHERRMGGELIVRHTDQVDHGLQAGCRRANRSRIVGIPGDDFRTRIVAESRFERLARAADHPVSAARRA